MKRLIAAAVERFDLDDAGDIRAVVCPSRKIALTPQPLRHLPCCALLRTPIGTIWMLRTIANVWTCRRLTSAVRLLSVHDGTTPTSPNAVLATRLQRALDLPSVEVLRPALRAVDTSQWQTRTLACALLKQKRSASTQSACESGFDAAVEALEGELLAALRAALRDFADGLDVDVLAVAPNSIDNVDVYNYLVPAAHRRNRLQLAADYPLLLRAAAGDSQPVGETIRHAVDAGAPLVRELSRGLGVSPSAVRCLRKLTADVVGVQWESEIATLIAVLHRLPPESRPSADQLSWREFNARVKLVESLVGRPVWESPLAVSWLCNAARHSRGFVNFRQDGAPPLGESASVNVLRQALIEAVSAASDRVLVTHEDGKMRAVCATRAVDGYLARFAPHRLIDMARRYHRELAVARAELANTKALANSESFWPLLPEKYLSNDGLRVVWPLTTSGELLRQGKALNNCLGKAYLAHFASRCRRGDSFIVAILDAATGAPQSTAELRVTMVNGRYGARILQHTAMRNRAPVPACRRALSELLERLQSESAQRHIGDGVLANAKRSRMNLRVPEERQRLVADIALRTLLGARLDELVAATWTDRSS